jgi:hypothetical protein
VTCRLSRYHVSRLLNRNPAIQSAKPKEASQWSGFDVRDQSGRDPKLHWNWTTRGANYGDFGFHRAFPVLARPLSLWQGSAALRAFLVDSRIQGMLP